MKFNAETRKFELSMAELLKLLKEGIPYQIKVAVEGPELMQAFFEEEVGNNEDVLNELLTDVWQMTENAKDPAIDEAMLDELDETQDEIDEAMAINL